MDQFVHQDRRLGSVTGHLDDRTIEIVHGDEVDLRKVPLEALPTASRLSREIAR